MRSFLNEIKDKFESLEESPFQDPMRQKARTYGTSGWGDNSDGRIGDVRDDVNIIGSWKDEDLEVTRNYYVLTKDKDSDGMVAVDDEIQKRIDTKQWRGNDRMWSILRRDKAERYSRQKEVDEQSTSAGAGAYNTPNAFAKKEKTKMKYPGVAESINQKYEKIIRATSAMIEEGSYRDYKTDPKSTPAKKVNGTIREIAQKLKEIENLAVNAAKLKTEQGVTQDHYWKSSGKNLENVGRRLIKISERIRALGA